MRAVVYLGDGTFEIRDVPTPVPGAGEVLLRVEANTICGTDLRILSGAKTKGVTPPVVLGHEVAGTVVEVGSDVQGGLAVGDRVGVTPAIPCNGCWSCQRGLFHLCARTRVLGHDVDGGLAEYFLAARSVLLNGGLVRAPEHLLPEEVALAEPLSCVLHAHGILLTGVEDVVVILGGGPIGQLHAQVARARGARAVLLSEPLASRRDLARRLGVDVVLDPTAEELHGAVQELSGGRGADVVVVCVGVPELVSTAIEIAAARARVSLFAGFPAMSRSEADANAIHYREIVVTGSSNSTAAEYATALDLIGRGGIDVASLVTHRFPLEQFEEGVQTATNPAAVKVAVTP